MSKGDGRHRDGGESGRPPARVRTATQVNVAFPFSKFVTREPSEELVEMAGLLREIADLLGELAPGSESERIRARAGAIIRSLT